VNRRRGGGGGMEVGREVFILFGRERKAVTKRGRYEVEGEA
jgi:hypothetical protein